MADNRATEQRADTTHDNHAATTYLRLPPATASFHSFSGRTPMLLRARCSALGVRDRVVFVVVLFKRRPVMRPRDRDVDRDRTERVLCASDARDRSPRGVILRSLVARDLVHRVSQSDANNDQREHNTLHACRVSISLPFQSMTRDMRHAR